MNILLFIIEIIVVFSLLLVSKKLFKKNGVIMWMALAPIIANIQTAKSVDLFGISTTLGTIMFASTFLATDIMSECYGKEEAKKTVFIGAFTTIVFLISMQLCLKYTPNALDYASGSLETLFSLIPRISIASLIMFFIANYVDVILYNKLFKKFEGKKMWLRNNICTIVCNCLENFGFVFLAFAGIYALKDIVMIAVSTSIIEIIIALCDTPFLYLAKKIK